MVIHSQLRTHLHSLNEGCDVGGGATRVGDGGEVIEVGSSSVPVHHHHVHVTLRRQQVGELLDPDGWRPGGPVAVDDEGGGSSEVEQRHAAQVAMEQLTTAVRVGSRVEQQTDVQAGSHERLMEIEVREVIAAVILEC